MHIDFPLLNSESYISDPLLIFDIDYLLQHIGIGRVLMYNKTNNIGVLPVRTPTGNYFPKSDTYILGTYTFMEIKKALEEGYELLAMEWSITWKQGHNPFTELTPRLYERRKQEKDPFNNFFYKEMQNRSYGKMRHGS